MDAAPCAIDARLPWRVLHDVCLQSSRMDGLELLEEIKKRDPSLPVLMISGHGNIDTAVAAIRKGRSEEHTSELQSLMRISYAVFCLKKKRTTENMNNKYTHSIFTQ